MMIAKVLTLVVRIPATRCRVVPGRRVGVAAGDLATLGPSHAAPRQPDLVAPALRGVRPAHDGGPEIVRVHRGEPS